MDVACLFVPDFLIALARRDDPRLVGRPVVVGGSPEEHSQVRACSREAAAVGVIPGMTLRRALALCPTAVFLPFQETHAGTEAARITEQLGYHSPAIESVAPGHVHFDVRGLAAMMRTDDETFLRDLHQTISSVTGLPVQLAGAATVFAAHAAAVGRTQDSGLRTESFDAEDRGWKQTPVLIRSRSAIPGEGSSPQSSALVVRDDDTRRFLAGLPVEALPVAPAMHMRLRLFGLERLGQLAALPFSAMQAQFGHEGARAWELANGRDDARITPALEEVRVVEEIEMPAPTALAEPLVAGTRALLQRALERPELRGHSLRRLDWRLELESGEELSRRFVFREPTADPVRMLFVVRSRIERLQLPAAATGLVLTLSGLCSEYGHQANLWSLGPRRQRELLEAVEQLNAREGEPQVFRVVEVQPWSRIPERQLALVAFGP
ncbi:hypothetical protein AYO38_01415 [bacterium SCGC AG-212-C10]|nr:hypothetical protein AYO38_01415 [bacterium SCGC AG-212-C10]